MSSYFSVISLSPLSRTAKPLSPSRDSIMIPFDFIAFRLVLPAGFSRLLVNNCPRVLLAYSFKPFSLPPPKAPYQTLTQLCPDYSLVFPPSSDPPSKNLLIFPSYFRSGLFPPSTIFSGPYSLPKASFSSIQKNSALFSRGITAGLNPR